MRGVFRRSASRCRLIHTIVELHEQVNRCIFYYKLSKTMNAL